MFNFFQSLFKSKPTPYQEFEQAYYLIKENHGKPLFGFVDPSTLNSLRKTTKHCKIRCEQEWVEGKRDWYLFFPKERNKICLCSLTLNLPEDFPVEPPDFIPEFCSKFIFVIDQNVY